MALVTYSDSEGSESESPPNPKPADTKPAPPSSSPKFIVDRGNPRKIRVNLADSTTNGDKGAEDDDNNEHTRKRPRLGGGGGLSGFNSMLPAPKRAKQELAKKGVGAQSGEPGSTRKVFSLKTSATKGFDREDDAGQDRGQGSGEQQLAELNQLKAEDVVPKGNAMMFKPLSVSRNTGKKKKSTASPQPAQRKEQTVQPAAPAPEPAPAPKPKVSLFGMSNEEKTDSPEERFEWSTAYEPLIYNSAPSGPAPGPAPPPDTQPDSLSSHPSQPQPTPNQAEPQSLENIASDLNLSQSEMRQLLGRRGQETSRGAPKVLTFNTDQEYKSNAEYISVASDAELASQQHNPVRSIAPGKHNLQQLVNQVSNQRDALEDSFASGKRNRKEAGSRYGW